MQDLKLLSEQDVCRLIGMTRSELKRHTQQRSFGLRPRVRDRGACYYSADTVQDFQRSLNAQLAAESLFN